MYQKLFPAEYFDAFVAQGTRPDGRHLQQLRAASVRTGIVSTARSSAAAYIGATSVVAGVSMELAVPSLEAPDVGKAVCKVCYVQYVSWLARKDFYSLGRHMVLLQHPGAWGSSTVIAQLRHLEPLHCACAQRCISAL